MNDPKEQARGLDSGADGRMSKPFDAGENVARIESTLRNRQAEDAPRKSEKHCRMLFNSMTDPIMVLDRDHKILEANNAMLELFGQPQEEVLGQSCFCLVHKTESPIQDCPHSQMLLDGLEHFHEVFIPELNAHLLVKVTPLHDDNGAITGSIHVARDISPLKNAEKQLKKISEEYERVFHGTQDAMFLVEALEDGTFRFIRNNKAHQTSTGLSIDNLRGKTPEELLGQELGEIVSKTYMECVQAGKPVSYEEELSLPGGKKIWHTTLTPVFENGKAAYIVGSAQDITQRKLAEEKLRFLATTDELTGLWNRRHFMEVLEQEIERTRRYGQSVSLLMLDIDHFKNVNDRYGHAVGDLVLRHLADLLREHLRRIDMPGRLGGEEFAVILPQTDAHGAYAIAERLRTSIQRSPAKTEKADISFTASIGLAVSQSNISDPDVILKMADDALYRAKRAGRNKTIVNTGQ